MAVAAIAIAVIIFGSILGCIVTLTRTDVRLLRQRTARLEDERGPVRIDLLNHANALRLHEARIQALEALAEPEPPPLPPRGDLHPQQFLPDFPG